VPESPQFDPIAPKSPISLELSLLLRPENPQFAPSIYACFVCFHIHSSFERQKANCFSREGAEGSGEFGDFGISGFDFRESIFEGGGWLRFGREIP
jgi:hypothetical protein